MPLFRLWGIIASNPSYLVSWVALIYSTWLVGQPNLFYLDSAVALFACNWLLEIYQVTHLTRVVLKRGSALSAVKH